MDIEIVFDELEHRIDAEGQGLITEDDMTRWTAKLGVERDVLYDAIAAIIAVGFHRRERTFEFCDRVVNDLFVAAKCDAQRGLFWKVFLAFDAGEYFQKGQSPDEDPVECFTRPQIAEIVLALTGE